VSEFELKDADAELARERGVVVVTTLVGATRLKDAERAEQDALNARNLRRLLAHHVSVAVGSDSYREDALAEAVYLASLHAVSNAELIEMWTEATAAAIYPRRRIGRLDEGSSPPSRGGRYPSLDPILPWLGQVIPRALQDRRRSTRTFPVRTRSIPANARAVHRYPSKKVEFAIATTGITT
jgi:hypothetical protein